MIFCKSLTAALRCRDRFVAEIQDYQIDDIHYIWLGNTYLGSPMNLNLFLAFLLQKSQLAYNWVLPNAGLNNFAIHSLAFKIMSYIKVNGTHSFAISHMNIIKFSCFFGFNPNLITFFLRCYHFFVLLRKSLVIPKMRKSEKTSFCI